MEGARWDIQQGIIMESRLKELYPQMPVINIRVCFLSVMLLKIFINKFFIFRLLHKINKI